MLEELNKRIRMVLPDDTKEKDLLYSLQQVHLKALEISYDKKVSLYDEEKVLEVILLFDSKKIQVINRFCEQYKTAPIGSKGYAYYSLWVEQKEKAQFYSLSNAPYHFLKNGGVLDVCYYKIIDALGKIDTLLIELYNVRTLQKPIKIKY